MAGNNKSGLSHQVERVKDGDKAMNLPDSEILKKWNMKKDAEDNPRWAQSIRDSALEKMKS